MGSMTDSLCNIQLFQRFCHDVLPYNICYLSIEDIFYMHSSIKLRLECLLADLFTVLEVKPAKCVKLPGAQKDHIIEVPESRFSSTPDPDRVKSPSRSNGTSFHHRPDSRTDRDTSGDEAFVVQRGRSIPTLASVSNSHRSISPGSDLGQKERLNQDTKSEERGETDTPSLTRSNSVYEHLRSQGAAGRPSDARDTPRSFAGRRSRRNSVAENESQISLENIGGSTENLSVIGRNPDKEMKVHSGKKPDNVVSTLRRGSANHQTFDIRKLSDETNPDNEVKMFIDNKELDAMEKHEREGSPYGGKASQNVNMSNKEDREKKTSFADLRRKSQTQNQFASSGINITYSEGDEKEDPPKRYNSIRRESDKDSANSSGSPMRSWAQQPNQTSYPNMAGNSDEMNDKLNSVRMKLEERRKRIEEEKRKMEMVMSRQREKGGAGGAGGAVQGVPDTSAIQSNWLSERNKAQPGPPTYNADQSKNIDPYTRTFSTMNDSLHELQTDIQKLATQQSQIQKMMQTSPQSPQNPSQYLPQQPQPPSQPHNPMDPQPFYIAGAEPQQQVHQQQQQQQPQRRTWGQPQPINFGNHGMGWNGQMPGPPGQMPGPRPPMYGAPQYPQYDQYGNPLIPRDQWGNPIPQGPMYNGGQPQGGYDQYGQPTPYGQPQPYGQQGPYSGHPYGQQPYGSAYNSPQQQQQPPTYSPMASPSNGTTARTPFRLHDSPSGPMSPRTSNYMRESDPNADPAASSNTSTPRHGYSRQSSREQLSAPSADSQSTLVTPRRLHTSVPAPAADDMAPQNVSFIENSTDNDDDNEDKSISPVPAPNGSFQESRSDSNLSERLKRLNISRGDKTYRVQLHADGREPTTVDEAVSPTRSTSRPTISSTFKERRRESSEGSGPGSMSGPGSITQTPSVQTKLTDEEIDALNTMKTEVLKETGDPSKGFVISFDDDSPVKPKPKLKPRRMSKKSSRDEIRSSDPVMIMLDMNEDADSDNRETSPIRKLSPSHRMNSLNGKENRLGSPNRYIDPSQWNSFGEEGGLKSPDDHPIPSFDIDPEVPLEPMVALNDRNTTGSDSDSRPANTGLIIGDELAGNMDQNEMAKKKDGATKAEEAAGKKEED